MPVSQTSFFLLLHQTIRCHRQQQLVNGSYEKCDQSGATASGWCHWGRRLPIGCSARLFPPLTHRIGPWRSSLWQEAELVARGGCFFFFVTFLWLMRVCACVCCHPCQLSAQPGTHLHSDYELHHILTFSFQPSNRLINCADHEPLQRGGEGVNWWSKVHCHQTNKAPVRFTCKSTWWSINLHRPFLLGRRLPCFGQILILAFYIWHPSSRKASTQKAQFKPLSPSTCSEGGQNSHAAVSRWGWGRGGEINAAFEMEKKEVPPLSVSNLHFLKSGAWDKVSRAFFRQLHWKTIGTANFPLLRY